MGIKSMVMGIVLSAIIPTSSPFAEPQVYVIPEPSGEEPKYSGGVRSSLCNQFAQIEFDLLPATREKPFAFKVSGIDSPLVFRVIIANANGTGYFAESIRVARDGIYYWKPSQALWLRSRRTASLPCLQADIGKFPSLALSVQDIVYWSD